MDRSTMERAAIVASGSFGNCINNGESTGHHATFGTDRETGKRQHRGGNADTSTRKRRKVLSDAAKISSAEDQSLQSFLGLITSVQCADIFEASPPRSFVRELLANLLRLLPWAAASPVGASSFIECLRPFEDLDGFVLPSNFYRAVAAAEDPSPPTPPTPREHGWRRKNKRCALATSGGGGGTAATGSLSSQHPGAALTAMTGLHTVREYLCMNGRDSVECGRRTVAATLTRALLGSWEGSVAKGRELFDQSVLMNPDRSTPVGLGLEILLQCLVHDDDSDEAKEVVTNDKGGSDQDADHPHDTDWSGCDSEDNDSDDDSEEDDDTVDRRRSRRRGRRSHSTSTSTIATPAPKKTWVPLSPAEETRACVTIVGNYVRADPDTSASCFRDILPTILFMGMGMGAGEGPRREYGGPERGRAVGPGRIPRRLAGLLRSLVESTRSRQAFNVERMVVHTVKAVRRWGDPSTVMSSASPKVGGGSGLDDDDGDDDDFSMGCTRAASGAAGEKSNKSKKRSDNSSSWSDKLRRRGLVLACLDILGPTAMCLSLIRQEMVEGETKASLRSAVADGLLEYRRTCDTADADRVQTVLLGVLSSLAVDAYVGVRLSALAAIGEGCSSDCVPAASLLLERCLDTAPKVRALAIRLLVDEFRLGAGPGGTSLAWTVLMSPRPLASVDDPQGGHNAGQAVPAPCAGSRNGPGGQRSGKICGDNGGARRQETERGDSMPLLGQLLRHQHELEGTDRERFPVLLKGLVETVLRGKDVLPRTVRASKAHGSIADNPHISERVNVAGGSAGTTSPRHRSPSTTPTAVEDPLLDPRCGGGGVAWEDLAAPAVRLYASCRPWDLAQFGALDSILGEIFDGVSDPDASGE